MYQVKKNETLGSIAKQHGTTVDALRKANNLEPKNDTKLQIGTKLNIPHAANQSGVKSSFNFSFNTITADNARSFMPTPLGLKAPKPGSSGGFSGQFMRAVMGNDQSSSGVGSPFTKISLGTQSSFKWGPATVISTTQISQSQGPITYSSKITVSSRLNLTNEPLGNIAPSIDAEVFMNFQISRTEGDSTINYKIPMGQFGFISFKHNMNSGSLESIKIGLTPKAKPSAYLEIKNATVKF